MEGREGGGRKGWKGAALVALLGAQEGPVPATDILGARRRGAAAAAF